MVFLMLFKYVVHVCMIHAKSLKTIVVVVVVVVVVDLLVKNCFTCSRKEQIMRN